MLEVAEAQEGIWLKRIKGADWHLVDELDQAIWNGDKMIYYDEVLSTTPIEHFETQWTSGNMQRALINHTNGYKSDFAIIDMSYFNGQQRLINLVIDFVENSGQVDPGKIIFVY